MRRRAAFYLLLGLVTALLMVALATGVQTRGSTDPNDWMQAHRHGPVLQMLDLASAFLFIIIGLYGLTVSRLQLQLQHQAEDFGDQMQTLLHRNDELAKVNEEYAVQIAALEADHEEKPALAMGDSSQRVISALHWQVDAQARQLEAVHRALEHQQDTLQELQHHVYALATNPMPSLSEAETAPPTSETEPADTESANAEDSGDTESVGTPLPDEEDTIVTESVYVADPEVTQTADEDDSETAPTNEPLGITDWTVNDGSTLVVEMLDFDVSSYAAPKPVPPPRPQAVTVAEARSYPLGSSFLAVAAGHLSSMPEHNPPPTPEPERVEISVGKDPAKAAPAETTVELTLESSELPPVRTEGALALDLAESALSNLQLETQEALSSLRAQVEATIPPETEASAPTNEPVKSNPAGRRKPWRMRI